MKISIIVPVYNECRTLRQLVQRVRHAPLPPDCSAEMIVVDDGSTDGTAQIVAEEACAGNIVAQRLSRNLGKGSAIRAGIEISCGEMILIQDADLEYDPNDYRALLEPLINGKADVVYGSRFLGKAVGMRTSNRIANRILAAAANLLYGAQITDEATAYKAFRASLLRTLRLNCRRFEFCPEVTAKLRRLGYRIHEVPIHYIAPLSALLKPAVPSPKTREGAQKHAGVSAA